ncbi:unnamed protein product [Sphagnum balticum]
MPPSQIRMNFHDESETGINRQINLELYSSYVYASMATYFDRDDVALGYFAKYLHHQSDEEREHAKMLMHYQNMRGGRVVLQDVKKPEKDEWGTAADALEAILALEKKVNQSLLDLHKIAAGHNDAQMCDYLEGKFLKEQVESIHEVSTIMAELKRAGPAGLGEYLWDKTTMKKAD